MGPEPGQARQLVLELGELDLEPALVGLGVEGEDVEDQPAPVDDLDVEQALQGLLLALGGEELLDRRLGLLERLLRGLRDLLDLEDVVAELRLDRALQLALLG